jgi:hypothetical protein
VSLVTVVVLSPVYTAVTWQCVYMSQHLQTDRQTVTSLIPLRRPEPHVQLNGCEAFPPCVAVQSDALLCRIRQVPGSFPVP